MYDWRFWYTFRGTFSPVGVTVTPLWALPKLALRFGNKSRAKLLSACPNKDIWHFALVHSLENLSCKSTIHLSSPRMFCVVYAEIKMTDWLLDHALRFFTSCCCINVWQQRKAYLEIPSSIESNLVPYYSIGHLDTVQQTTVPKLIHSFYKLLIYCRLQVDSSQSWLTMLHGGKHPEHVTSLSYS